MNIALVVLDTLRLDAFRDHFDWLPGIRFEQAWAPGNWTVPVHASLFTGRYPAELGVHAKHQTLNCAEPTLAECLNEVGYQTRAFSANPNVSPVFQFDRGFDEFRDSWRLRGMKSDVFDWEGFIAENRTRGPGRCLSALKEIVLNDVAIVPSLQRGVDLKLRDLEFRTPPLDDGARETGERGRRTTVYWLLPSEISLRKLHLNSSVRPTTIASDTSLTFTRISSTRCENRSTS